MIRPFFIVGLFFSVFFFPYVCTLIAMGLGALYLPSATLFAGMLVDMLYTPSFFNIPIGTVSALVFIGIAYLLRRFIQAHILQT